MKGMPGLYKRGKIYWYQPPTVNGIRSRPLSLQTEDLASAVAQAQELRLRPEILEGDAWDIEVERYFKSERRDGRLSATQCDNRKYILAAFSKFVGGIAPARVKEGDIWRYYEKRRSEVKIQTANQQIKYINRFFGWLVEHNRLRRNPGAGVRLAKVMTVARKDFLPAPEVAKLIEAAEDPEVRFILLCGFDAGMRRLEICEARPEWFSDRSITITKTDTFEPKDRDERTVPLTDRFAEFLKEYGRPSPFMLRPQVKQGNFRYRFDIRKMFDRHIAEHLPDGQRITPHDMRRSFASNLVQAGVSIYKVATWLGDNVDTVSRHYAHLLPHDEDINMLV